jgi:hypothetical protein
MAPPKYVRADVSSDYFAQWMTYYTHYRKMAAPQYVSADVSSDYFADWMTYYTHYRKMAAPQYVSADVSSDKFADWMTYYTLYRKMAAPQYVSADVSSNDSHDWMNYYTRCNKMAAPHYVCIDVLSEFGVDWMNHHTHHRNTVAPHHVQVEVHSKYSGKWEEITWKIKVGREISLKPQYSEMLHRQAWERTECQWKLLAFVRKWPLYPDVWNGNGQTTLCRRRCEKTLQQLHMCQAIVPHSKACKHDFLLPGGAEWLPHRNTIAEPTAICYAVCVLIHMSCHDKMRVKK